MEGLALNWTCARLVRHLIDAENIQTKPGKASQPTATKSDHLQLTVETKLRSSCANLVLCALLLHIFEGIRCIYSGSTK